jgi:hypothetical protein
LAGNSRLRELAARRRELTATIKNCKAERMNVLAEMTRERARVALEQEQSDHALEPSVIAQRDAGMETDDIARALKRPAGQIRRIVTAFRKREGITIERRRPIPERHKIR